MARLLARASAFFTVVSVVMAARVDDGYPFVADEVSPMERHPGEEAETVTLDLHRQFRANQDNSAFNQYMEATDDYASLAGAHVQKASNEAKAKIDCVFDGQGNGCPDPEEHPPSGEEPEARPGTGLHDAMKKINQAVQDKPCENPLVLQPCELYNPCLHTVDAPIAQAVHYQDSPTERAMAHVASIGNTVEALRRHADNPREEQGRFLRDPQS